MLVLLLLFMNSTVKPHFWGWKLIMVNDLKKTIKNIKNYTINITRSRTHHHMFQDSQQQKREYMDFLDFIMIIMSPFQFTNTLHKKKISLLFHGWGFFMVMIIVFFLGALRVRLVPLCCVMSCCIFFLLLFEIWKLKLIFHIIFIWG